MARAKCSIGECSRPIVGRGMCQKHYSLWRTKERSEYQTLAYMKQRCYNPKHPNYVRYGAKGIKLCNRWRFGEGGKTGYELFLEDMGRKPTPKHSIDRIDPAGDYEPNNCRWATRELQLVNRRMLSSNKSGYVGVYWHIRDKKYISRIRFQGKAISLGRFDSAEAASKAYGEAREKYYGELLRS